jgi:hypothetical protein
MSDKPNAPLWFLCVCDPHHDEGLVLEADTAEDAVAEAERLGALTAGSPVVVFPWDARVLTREYNGDQPGAYLQQRLRWDTP